ncbi:MAG TPA: GntR family transcriptional regulator [Casimicrobiaceae bacterium]|nr:GntR family transcriptional regulator [Casimicrobiaceae bacterium]
MSTPDAGRADPLYRRIADDLIAKIRAHEIAPGAMLPTEHALCRMHGVSRITVRKALEVLADGHYVLRRRGVGTFVRPVDPDRWTATLLATLDEVMPPQRLVLVRQGTVRPPADVLAFAGLPSEERMRIFEATNHVANGAPLAHLQMFFPLPLGAKMNGAMFAGGLPPPRLVERLCGIRIDHAVQVVEATLATAKLARHLRVPAGAAVLRGLRVYRDGDRRPLYVTDAAYHPQHYRLAVHLQARAAATP